VFAVVLVLGVVYRVVFGVMLAGMLMRLDGMQVVAMRQLCVVRGGMVITCKVVLVCFAVMMGGGIVVMGCDLVVRVFRHGLVSKK
jgi:hypothetical protein